MGLILPEDKIDITDSTKPKAIGIVEGQVAYTDSKSPIHILASSNASSCIIISIYNPETKEAALAHIYEKTNVESLKEVFDNIKRDSKAQIQVSMAGAIEYAHDGKYEEIISFLKTIDNVKIDPKHENYIGQKGGTESLAIDTKTGKIFHNIRNLDINYAKPLSNEEFEALNKPHNLDKVFDGREIGKIVSLLSNALSDTTATNGKEINTNPSRKF